MSFGARLTAKRKEKNLTQEGLGKGLGTDGKDASKAVVYGWEKDQHFPRTDQLELICKRLNCSADYLLFGKEDAAGLTPEVAAVAEKIDAFPVPERGRVLRLVRQLLELADESVRRDFADSEKDRSTSENTDLHPGRSKAA